jgi:hypothetical protein
VSSDGQAVSGAYSQMIQLLSLRTAEGLHMLRVYSNPQNAFIFQLIVGFLCFLGILLYGMGMIAILALLGFRPLILSQRTVLDPAPYRQFFYRIGKISFVFTAITLVILYVFLQLFGNLVIVLGKYRVLAVLPYFIFVHGMVGLIFKDKSGTT